MDFALMDLCKPGHNSHIADRINYLAKYELRRYYGNWIRTTRSNYHMRAIITFGNGWFEFDVGQGIYMNKAMMPLIWILAKVINQVSINNDVIYGHRGTILRMDDLTQMFKNPHIPPHICYSNLWWSGITSMTVQKYPRSLHIPPVRHTHTAPNLIGHEVPRFRVRRTHHYMISRWVRCHMKRVSGA